MKQRLTILLILFICKFSVSDECDQWFKKSKLKASPSCVTKCLVLPTGMSTFACGERCQDFCDDRSFFEKLLGDAAYYPGLTAKEKELIRLHPTQALKAFLQKEKAESAAERVFHRDASDDESDAFRHFVWAGLLSKELGQDLAKQFLDAHEEGQSNDPGSAMDLANNRAGLLAADKLRRTGKLDQAEIEKEGLKELKEKTLVVLKPKGISK